MAITQNDIRTKLIQIYAGNDLDQINDALIAKAFSPSAPVQQQMEELTKGSSGCIYLNIKNHLEDFKKLIETEVNKPAIISSDQLAKNILYDVVLNLAISFAYDNNNDSYEHKMQLLFDLITAQFIQSGQWDQVLTDHFNFVFPVLKDWYSFFLSYTNREAFDINKRYENILSFGSISNERNQVARFIAEKLHNDSHPRAFIDEKEIEYGADFKISIDKALTTSFTFVQIISNESFKKLGKTNWCQYEFEKYNEALLQLKGKFSFYYDNVLKNNNFFLVMGHNLASVKPSYLIGEYREWYDKISDTNYFKFCTAQEDIPTGNVVTQNYTTFITAVRNLAIAIIQSKKKLIDAIPPRVGNAPPLPPAAMQNVR